MKKPKPFLNAATLVVFRRTSGSSAVRRVPVSKKIATARLTNERQVSMKFLRYSRNA
jgi:hypothetical protein